MLAIIEGDSVLLTEGANSVRLSAADVRRLAGSFPSSAPSDERWIRAERAAELMGCSLTTARDRMRDGTIPAVKAGKAWLTTETDVRRWLDERRNRDRHHLPGLQEGTADDGLRKSGDNPHDQGDRRLRMRRISRRRPRAHWYRANRRRGQDRGRSREPQEAENLNSNMEEALAVLSGEWQTTMEIAARIPVHGRTCMRTVAYASLRKLERYGLAEKRRTSGRSVEWRRK